MWERFSVILDFPNCVLCYLQNGKDNDYDDDYDDIIANAGAKVAQFIRVATEKGKNCKQTADCKQMNEFLQISRVTKNPICKLSLYFFKSPALTGDWITITLKIQKKSIIEL